MGSFVVERVLPFDEFVAVEDDNRRLIWVLEALPDERLLRYLRESREGHRNEYPPAMLWRCVVAKFVYQIKTYAELIRELWRNPSLRRIVGCRSQVPQDYHFSRFLKRLSSPECLALLGEMFDELGERCRGELEDFGRYLAVDATAVRADSNEEKKQKSDPDARWSRRPKRQRIGREEEEYLQAWFGYSVHLVVDCASELPVAYRVTPANVNETVLFRPMLRQLEARHPEVLQTTEAVIADAGYDSRENCEHVLRELEALPIIKMRLTQGRDEVCQAALCCGTELGTVICPSGHKMVYWGRDGGYLKWRCPAKVGRKPKVCTFRGGCGTPSEYGRVVKVRISEDSRRWPGLWRESRKFERLYRKRTAVERVNSRLKEHLLLDDLTIRGIDKVQVHVGVGLVVMLAGAWAMAQADRQDRMRRTVRLAA
jgi:transposase